MKKLASLTVFTTTYIVAYFFEPPCTYSFIPVTGCSPDATRTIIHRIFTWNGINVTDAVIRVLLNGILKGEH